MSITNIINKSTIITTGIIGINSVICPVLTGKTGNELLGIPISGDYQLLKDLTLRQAEMTLFTAGITYGFLKEAYNVGKKYFSNEIV